MQLDQYAEPTQYKPSIAAKGLLFPAIERHILLVPGAHTFAPSLVPIQIWNLQEDSPS